MSAEPEDKPVTRQPQGPMRQLSPEQRRRWQSETLTAPRRRYGADARLLFKLEDLVFGMARTQPKFRARELIARTPYQSWEQAAYIEDHAEYEYAALVAEHPEWETTPYHSAVAAGYGTYESLADVFRQIGCDEGVHKEISLARTKRPDPVP